MADIRICFFADGMSVHTQRWLKEIAVRGFEVTLVTRRPWSHPGVRVITIGDSSGVSGWFSRIAAIRRIVRELHPDIVHGHYVTSFGFWAAASGVRPLVQTAWGSDILVSPKRSRLVRWLTRWSLAGAALITADSLDTLAEIRKYAPHSRLEQVQWGVDLDLIKPADAPPRTVLNLLSMRSWEEIYNIDRILQAVAALRSTAPEIPVHLHLLGGGSQEGALRSLAASLGITDQVTFHGMVNETELVEILALTDISLSVPSSDATAMSLLESMAAGLPVIVTDLPANRQWIDDNGGRIVPVADVGRLTEALVELAGNPGLRRAMGGRNRAVIEAKASRRTEMDRMAAMYRELLKDKGAIG